MDKATYATDMRKNKDDTDDPHSVDNEVVPRDHQNRNATVRDTPRGTLSMARRTVAQDNAPINNDNDLKDQARKAVWAMTNEKLAFRKVAKDMEKCVKTKHVYRPPALALARGSDKAPRMAATVSVRAEVPEAPPVTETDGDGTGVVAPRPVGGDMATAATPGTGVASEETLSVSAPPSVVGVIQPAQPLSSARNRSGATGAAPSDDMSSDEEPDLSGIW